MKKLNLNEEKINNDDFIEYVFENINQFCKIYHERPMTLVISKENINKISTFETITDRRKLINKDVKTEGFLPLVFGFESITIEDNSFYLK